MNRLWKYIACLALLVLPLIDVCAKDASGPPKIVCKKPVHAFGSVSNKKDVEHTFVLWNEGATPLNIKRVRGCCGANKKLGSSAIAPGTNTTLWVRLSLKGRKGNVRKSLYVASNDPNQPYYQLRFLGKAIAGTASKSTPAEPIESAAVAKKAQKKAKVSAPQRI